VSWSHETPALVLLPENLGLPGFEGLGSPGLGRSVSRHRRSWFYPGVALLIGVPIVLALLRVAEESGSRALFLVALLLAGALAFLVGAERKRRLVLCEHGLAVLPLFGAERLVPWTELTATFLTIHKSELGPAQVGSLRLETRAGRRLRLDTNWSQPNTVRVFLLWLHRAMNPPVEVPVDPSSLGYRLGAWLRQRRQGQGNRPT